MELQRIDPEEDLEVCLTRRLADAMQRRADAMFGVEESLILHGNPSAPTPQGIIYAGDTPIIVEE